MGFVRDVLRVLVLGFVIGIVLNGCIFAIDAFRFLSKSQVFDELNIGTSDAVAIATLKEANVWCDLSSSNYCRFSDFWSDYEIGIDPARRIVSSKSSIRARKDKLALRLFRF